MEELDASELLMLLRANNLDGLYTTLKGYGMMEISDLRYLTAEIVDDIVATLQMPLIQRRKFEHMIEQKRQQMEQLEELNRTERMKEIYALKYETMKNLLDTNKITVTEFDEWRHEEFLRTFNTVNK